MIYYEGNGKPRPATYDEMRDLLMNTIATRRDEIVNAYLIEDNDNPKDLANAIISSTLQVIDGKDTLCPSMALVPEGSKEAEEEAKEAGGNWIPHGHAAIDLSGGLADYWAAIND